MKKQLKPERIDNDNPAWTAAEARAAVKFTALPPSLQTKLRGRPKADTTKEPVKIRIDADVLAVLRASGDGWQTRINDTLRASLQLAGKLG